MNADATRRREMERRAAEIAAPAGRGHGGRRPHPGALRGDQPLARQVSDADRPLSSRRIDSRPGGWALGWTVGTVRGRVARAVSCCGAGCSGAGSHCRAPRSSPPSPNGRRQRRCPPHGQRRRSTPHARSWLARTVTAGAISTALILERAGRSRAWAWRKSTAHSSLLLIIAGGTKSDRQGFVAPSPFSDGVKARPG